MAINLNGSDTSTYSSGASFGTTNTAPAANNVEGCTIGDGGKYISISRENDLCLELNYKGTSGPGVAFRLLNDGDGANPSITFDRNGSATFAGGDVNIAANAGLRLGQPGNDTNASIEIVSL